MTLATGALGGHALHLVEALAFFVVSIGAVGVGEAVAHHRRRAAESVSIAVPAAVARVRRPAFGGLDLTAVVALGAVVAGIVHLLVLPEHVAESALYGAFFAASAATQLGWAALIVVRPGRRLLLAGVAGNAAVVVVWALTRTVGIPLGPAAGEVEAVGALDIVATAAELIVVVGGMALLAAKATSARSARQDGQGFGSVPAWKQ